MSNSRPKIVVKIPVGTLLVLLFTTLKLAKVIKWSWWIVFAPIWLPFAFLSSIALLVLFVSLIVKVVDHLKS